jgi:hypothetical protein
MGTMRASWGAVAALSLVPAVSFAGGKITIGENQSVTVGGGLRTSVDFVEDGAPSGTDYSKDFRLDSVRLYLGGQVAKGLSAEFNTEYDGGNAEAVRVLDANVKIEYCDAFRVWAGRFLPPSDRANLDGPYYMPIWDYPAVSAFPAIFAGRDDGVAVWGQFNGGGFKYQAGVFQGSTGEANSKEDPLFAGRLVLNLRDPEPGYYNGSTYWGAKKILAIAVTGQHQSAASGTVAQPLDFTGVEADVLFEQPTDGGVVTAEGAFYNFDWGSDANASTGSAYYVWAGYLFKAKTGPGQFQPTVRYQNFNSKLAGADFDKLDVGLGYIIAGDNARFHATYSRVGGDVKRSEFKLGAQLQF